MVAGPPLPDKRPQPLQTCIWKVCLPAVGSAYEDGVVSVSGLRALPPVHATLVPRSD